MADAYRYEALPSDTHTRYLLLQPGESGDQIVCSLHVTEIEDPTAFEAISYAWGKPDRTEPIQCDGKTLYVTVNLRDSLVAVREPNEARALWVDSICINQDDNAEKSQQVSLMADIYRKSTRTLICIGLDDGGGHAEAVSGILTTVNHMMDETFRDKNFSWKPDSFPWLPTRDPLASGPRWKSVPALLAQPWFKRLWVVQEAALGPLAEIIWGGVRIDWSHLLRAYFWIMEKANTIAHSYFRVLEVSWLHVMAYERRFPRECVALASAGYHQSQHFLIILNTGRSLGATDPRDRIYACLSLLHSTPFQGPQVTTLKPDYNKTYLQVYHDFACAYLETTGMCLDLLAFTEHDDYTGIPANNVPSWVPRWNLHIYNPIYKPSSRRQSSQFPDVIPSTPCLLDRSVLKVRGVRIGFVEFVTETLSHHMTLEVIGRVWREVERLGTSSHMSPNPYNTSAKTGFVGTLNAGYFERDVDEWYRREAAYMDYVERKFSYVERKFSQLVGDSDGDSVSSTTSEEGEEVIAATAFEVHKIVMPRAHSRKLIVSDRGYYGLAPSAVERGDAIFIIFGTTSPFLLRPTSTGNSTRSEKYKLVGEMFMFSAVGAGSGKRLVEMGKVEGHDDWHDWALQEQDILIC